MKLKAMLAVVVGVGVLATSLVTQADFFRAKDPGPRGGPAGAGGPLPGLTVDPDLGIDEPTMFADGREDFAEAEGVGDGLGPRFNLDSCGGCHIQPERRRHVARPGGLGGIACRGRPESSGRHRHRLRRQEQGAVLHQGRRPGPRGAVQVQSGWQPGRRSPHPVRDQRAQGRNR